MEHQPAMTWPEQIHENTLISAPGEDEFSNFLEFNMHFTDLEGHGPAHSQMQEQQHAMVPPTTTAPESAISSDHRSQSHQYATPIEGLAMDFGHGPVQSHGMSYSTPRPAYDPPRHQTVWSCTETPPATPQRVDENADMYDRYSRINEEQALYTPLVSPAMTPLESQFRVPEYTVPGEYFTPLTSPALEAQNTSSSNNGYPFHARQMSDVGFVATHAEMNHLPGTSAPPSPSIIRKTNRRRTSTTSRLPGRSKVKQSPSLRAQTQRNRGKPVPHSSEEFYNSLTHELSKPQNHDVRSLQVSSNEGSGQDSVSPEPLSEPLMPPPALPPPRQSPAFNPVAQSPGTAATPATLMRIQRSQHARDPLDQFTGQAQLEIHDEIMEDIALPEAAAPPIQPRPRVNRIETSLRTSTASPVLSAHGTPSLEPRSAAERTPASIAMSPCTVAMPSPSGPVPKRSDPSRSSISSRKRPSVSSTQASPQLRPKISPSIQPLMRSGEVMSQDALYLASKSNYQHILDGTLPSGVSYPEALAENLSSKRTNHKLAEQGRRNRINSALKEIETLIPPDFVQARQAKEAALTGIKPADKEKEKASNQAISKASAVEMAIDYIKALKKSLDDTTEKLAATEAKLAGTTLDDKSADTPAAVTGKEVNGTGHDSANETS
ncbi:hypothetical protein N7448_000877 [Penicillium atrosanguineum]|nr:hypothetical protein N7448_000877 [Penicillium atrosanguineum]